MTPHAERFARVVGGADEGINLAEAALLIAAEEYRNLDIDSYLGKLDDTAATLKRRLRPDISQADSIIALNRYLFDELGYAGDAANYYDARNSFLNDVIDRRTGIPITLSVVYLEVARRMGLKLFGVGMPGHFIVKYADDEQEIFVDPFHGGLLLTEDRCREIIAEMYSGEVEFQPAFLQAVTGKQILIRMLQNLKAIYAHAGDHHKTLGVVERILLIKPDSITEIRDRGLVYLARGRYDEAKADLEKYLRDAPLAEDVGEIKKRLSQLRQRQAQLN